MKKHPLEILRVVFCIWELLARVDFSKVTFWYDRQKSYFFDW